MKQKHKLYFCSVLRIAEHIETLLIRHDYVVIPDFGGFVLQNNSAVIIENTIIPPSQTICFNPLMKHSDGLLAIEISRKENISFRVAMQLIESELKAFTSEINSGKTVVFGRLGCFNKPQNSNLFFQPVDFAEFLPGNLGLLPVIAVVPVIKKDTVTLHFKRKTILKYAAAVIFIIGLLFVTPPVNDTKLQNTARLIPTDLQPTLQIKSIYNDSVTTTTTNQLNATLLDSTKIIPTKSETYHVIVACLATENNADNFSKELTDEGFTHVQVLHPEKTYRVSIEAFSTKEEAINYMEKLRKSESRFESAWVLCN